MEAPTELTREPSRWALFRDVAVFQGKLIIDGLRDLVLVPLSLAAALIGVFTEPRNPGRKFYSVVALGRRSERWINLFGAARATHPDEFREDDPDQSVDDLISMLERRIVEQHDRGGITAQARRAVDGALDRLTHAVDMSRGGRRHERAQDAPAGGDNNEANSKTGPRAEP